MKKLTLLTLALTGLFISCSKEKDDSFEIIDIVSDGNKITYGIECESCTAFIDVRNEPKKRFDVKGVFIRSEINKLDSINISIVGTGKIRSKITANDKVIHDVTTEQTGNTVNYKVAIK